MKRSVAVAVSVAAMSAAGAGGVAFAVSGDAPNDGPASGVSARAIGGAQAPNSRLAAYVNPDGSVVRSKGVAKVTKPSTGQFCIKPKASANINIARMIPLVTVDWSTSSGDALMAHWRSSGGGCPAGFINVQTVNGSDGSFNVDDGVAFTISIP